MPLGWRSPGRNAAVVVAFLTLAMLHTAGAPTLGRGSAESTDSAGPPPKPSARAWILIDASDDRVLTASAAGRRRSIASTTKLMTAYTVIRLVSPERSVEVRGYEPNGIESLAGIRPGKRMRVADLLYAMLLPSGNDAASTLAVASAGSRADFVRAMNREAARLGLEDSSFSNPIGLDGKDNFSSARDLAILGSEALRDDLLRRIVGTRAKRVRVGAKELRVVNRNTLLSRAAWVNGVKTGYTNTAGYSIVASGERGGVTLVAVVLGAPSEAARDSGSFELLEWGFSGYREKVEARKGDELGEVGVANRLADVPLVASRRLAVLHRPKQEVDVELRVPEEVEGPVRRGERIGSAVAVVAGRPASSVPLLARRSERSANGLETALGTLFSPLGLVLLGAIFLLSGAFLAWRSRRASFPDDDGAGA